MENITFCTNNHILVGLGGTGGKILREFKMRMFEEFPTQEERKKQPVALLYVDSTEEMMPKDGRARADFRVMGQDASFTQNEFLNIKSADVQHILDHIDNYPNIKGIVNNVSAVKTAIGSLGEAAGQKRRAGRLLFAVNAVGYVNSLNNAAKYCETVSGITASESIIHIFAGLCGGTGSGSIVDAVIQARKALPNSKILVYVMIPEQTLPKADMDQGRYYQNGYAAMNELNALQSGRWKPQDVTGGGPIEDSLWTARVKGIANGISVYSNVNDNGLAINSLEELPKIVSDYLFARIFYINSQDKINGDIIRAYNFENMDDFPMEYDETENPDETGEVPFARTKKINSFGIKRVIYPELRVLKHITYTTAVSVLNQFKYNNWRENQGFVNEERNRDYRKDFLNKEQIAEWKLDLDHLTLDLKILPSDSDFTRFEEFWHDKSIGYAEDAKKADCPLNELDNILGDFYALHFREEGVENFFAGKERAIPEMAKEIRHNVENGLFEKWKLGDLSIVELQKVSKLLLEKMGDIRTDIEAAYKDKKDSIEEINEERIANVEEWSHLGILQRMIGNGARRYADHQGILSDLYTAKTQLVALDFAKKLAAKVFVEVGKMDADIASFGQKINDALDETERLVAAQRKVNKGLEDMKGAIVEVSEEEAMVEFEFDVKTDKIDMPNIARQIREAILPQTEFTNFGNLANSISIDDIKDKFDIKLSEIVRIKHNEKADCENKVLGLNILTQLQQKLKTDDDIKEFASKIINQSGVYLKLNNDEIQLHLRNNEGNLSPTNPASINKKAILVSIPSPSDNENLKRFADKLEAALMDSIKQSTARTTLNVNRNSPKKNELSVITVGYCFPMRAIDWMKGYKARYEKFLRTGNPNTDITNAILLHSEGDGKDLPSLFAVDNAAEIAKKKLEEKQKASGPKVTEMPSGTIPQPVPEIPTFPDMPIPTQKPIIQLRIAIAGQLYGPYDYDTCQQLVKNGQLTAQTMVWMEGLAAWTPAGQVPQLQSLFAPQMPPIPGAPGMPPIPGMPPMPGTPGMPPM